MSNTLLDQKNAIKKFQKDHNQVVDGIVGKKTIEAINKQIEQINRETVNTDVHKYNLGDRILKKTNARVRCNPT